MDEKEIKVGDWVYVGLFQGKVVRIREFKGDTWVDIEMGGVIEPYLIKDITKE